MSGPGRTALRTTAVLYIGVIVGVSLIATPAKFLAPSLSMGELLEVGRQTFRVFAWVEYTFAILLLVLAWRGGRRADLVLAGLVAAVVLLQHLALRPMLDVRVERIMVGETVERSMLHHLYAAGALIKLGLLVVLACTARSGPPDRIRRGRTKASVRPRGATERSN